MKSCIVALLALLTTHLTAVGQVSLETDKIIWWMYYSNIPVGQGNIIGEGSAPKSVAVFRINSETAAHRLARVQVDLGTNRAVWVNCLKTLYLYGSADMTNVLAATALNSSTVSFNGNSYMTVLTVTNDTVLSIGSSNVFNIRADTQDVIAPEKSGEYDISIPSNGIRVVRISDDLNFFVPDAPIVAPVQIVAANYAFISSFGFSSYQDLKVLYLMGIILPETDYDVETSTNLTTWKKTGQLTQNEPGNNVLKEPGVAFINSVEYADRCFIRLKRVK